MTLMLDIDLDMVKMYYHTKKEVSVSTDNFINWGVRGITCSLQIGLIPGLCEGCGILIIRSCIYHLDVIATNVLNVI